MTGYPRRRRSAAVPRCGGGGRLHPRSLVSVHLEHLGPVGPARHVPGRRRDGAELPALEATRGRVPGPRRPVHLRRPDRGGQPGGSRRPSSRTRRSRRRAKQEESEEEVLGGHAGGVGAAGSRGSRPGRRAAIETATTTPSATNDEMPGGSCRGSRRAPGRGDRRGRRTGSRSRTPRRRPWSASRRPARTDRHRAARRPASRTGRTARPAATLGGRRPRRGCARARRGTSGRRHPRTPRTGWGRPPARRAPR